MSTSKMTISLKSHLVMGNLNANEGSEGIFMIVGLVEPLLGRMHVFESAIIIAK